MTRKSARGPFAHACPAWALPLVLALGACHPAPTPRDTTAPAQANKAAPAADTTLYARLGGEAGAQAIASGLAARIATDGRVNPFFADTDMEAFKAGVAKFIAQLGGGPALYHGPDMKTLHHGLGIADAQFDAMMEDIGAALDQRQVSAADRAELLARLAALRGDIVIH